MQWLRRSVETNVNFDERLGIATLWNIWKARNEKTFNDRAPGVDTIILLSKRLRAEWGSTPRQSTPIPSAAPPQPPPPPAPDREILCDGSFPYNNHEAGYGVIVRDSHGEVVDGYAGTLSCSSPLVAEARALLEATRRAATIPGTSCIKTDCLTLVNALRKGPTIWPWECAAWLHIMDELLRTHPRIRISYIPRALNGMVDRVAKAAAMGTLPRNWIRNTHFLNQSL
ncbi:hypothetical protein LINPERHAP2_LOCUS39547 [Linum perenne]